LIQRGTRKRSNMRDFQMRGLNRTSISEIINSQARPQSLRVPSWLRGRIGRDVRDLHTSCRWNKTHPWRDPAFTAMTAILCRVSKEPNLMRKIPSLLTLGSDSNDCERATYPDLRLGSLQTGYGSFESGSRAPCHRSRFADLRQASGSWIATLGSTGAVAIVYFLAGAFQRWVAAPTARIIPAPYPVVTVGDFPVDTATGSPHAASTFRRNAK
jgi:hypothetical protein